MVSIQFWLLEINQYLFYDCVFYFYHATTQDLNNFHSKISITLLAIKFQKKKEKKKREKETYHKRNPLSPSHVITPQFPSSILDKPHCQRARREARIVSLHYIKLDDPFSHPQRITIHRQLLPNNEIIEQRARRCN